MPTADHPVAIAVAPLRVEAETRAATDARAFIDSRLAILAQNDWDLDRAFPRGDSRRDNRETYRAKTRRHEVVQSFTGATWITRRLHEPNTRIRSPEREAKFIADAVANAVAQYDAFVAKLVGKIGDCDSASLSGSHVWGYSILKVTKAEAIEHWKTTQIVNVSKLGLLFNQWPSRKVK